jgi:hypothetical protein
MLSRNAGEFGPASADRIALEILFDVSAPQTKIASDA